MSLPWFRRMVAVTIIYALIIILWGAFVRISGSGAGCGRHWPLCQGVILPEGDVARQLQTWIEFIHRAKSGLFGFLVLGLYLASFWIFPKGHSGRKAAFLSLFFTIVEALLGAALVLKGYVDNDQSLGRVIVQALHFANTLLLLGALAVLYAVSRPGNLRFEFAKRHLIALATLGFFMMGMSGAVASLSNTMFPSLSLSDGIQKDLSEDSHFILRFRILHPLTAVLFSSLFLYLIVSLRGRIRERHLWITILPWFIVGALMFGAVTLFSLSPTWMKLTHLLIADLLWIGLVVFFVRASTVDTFGNPT